MLRAGFFARSAGIASVVLKKELIGIFFVAPVDR
jgi:hypothetical protein